MKPGRTSRYVITLACAALLGTAPAFADKPEWAGGGKSDRGDRGGKGQGGEKHDEYRDHRHDDARDDRQRRSVEIRFGSDSHRIINDYYAPQFRSGHCPPGLAKKNNGCLPPGQAKKWSRGRPLPHDLTRYDLPRDLVIRLPVPPSGHRYVRVASDILLIAVGTGMVIDAIEDIGR